MKWENQSKAMCYQNKAVMKKKKRLSRTHRAVIPMYLEKGEHFPGCSEADSISTLAPGDLFSYSFCSCWCFSAEQIPGCRSIYAVSLRAP